MKGKCICIVVSQKAFLEGVYKVAIKMVSFRCDNCNAPLECEENKTFWFCPHCGNKCMLTDDSVKTNVNVNYNLDIERKEDAGEIAKYEAIIYIGLTILGLICTIGFMLFCAFMMYMSRR